MTAAHARFRTWQVERGLETVRSGMIVLFVAGWYLLAVGTLFDPDFVRGFWPAVVLSSPGFLVAAAATRLRVLRRRLIPIVATAVAVWALAITWGTHRGLDAPELGTVVIVIVLTFSVHVFRLPTLWLPAVVLPPVALHLVLLLQLPGGSVAGGVVAHASIAVAMLATAPLLGIVNERGDRLQFEQSEVIAAQLSVIEAERRHSDALLRRILPSSVVDRMRSEGGRMVDHHDGVTVVFADLVGFTSLTMAMDPGELVTLLERVFGWVDELAARHGVEKIKTVGDAYMAAAGVPDPRPDHARAVADFALDVRDGLPGLASRLSRPLEMRIGIATGPVVAGVIGESRFAYDLWADAVNTAARLEGLARPGEIHLDQATAQALGDGYLVTDRGVVEVRGRGRMATSVLQGRRDRAPQVPVAH